MNKKIPIALLIALAAGGIGLVILGVLYLSGQNIPVLNPKGTIADQQRNLMLTSTLLMMIVVVPVLLLTFGIAWRYRASNTKAKYQPDWDHSRIIETIWWVVPFIIILILAGIAWKSSHDLDPYKSLQSTKKPLKVQVVALQWRWLFIYPEQHIATINFMQFPQDTPIDFQITADAPMNSFWMPQLGGQVYAMSGMSTQLHLMASEPGDYHGSSANISGEGFAGMKFTARATNQQAFDRWVSTTQKSTSSLTYDAYEQLARPSTDSKAAYFALPDTTLYDTVVMKYMSPGAHH
jgi:cytochrome o ubiquinol oxidase subunit 2